MIASETPTVTAAISAAKVMRSVIQQRFRQRAPVVPQRLRDQERTGQDVVRDALDAHDRFPRGEHQDADHDRRDDAGPGACRDARGCAAPRRTPAALRRRCRRAGATGDASEHVAHAAIACFKRLGGDAAEMRVFGRGAEQVVARIRRVASQVGHHAAGPRRHHDDALREIDRLEHRMRDEHRREAVLPPQRQQVVVELVARDLVERRERLVHQQDLRMRHQRARDRDAHLHAAGEFARIGFLEALQPDQRQHLGRARLRLALADARERQRQHHVLQRVRPRHQRRVLEHEAEIGLRLAARRMRRGRPVDRAGARRAEARDDAQQGRLAAAGRPEQADELAVAQIEIDAADRERAVRELLGDVADRNERAACLSQPPRSHGHAPTPLFTNSRL